MKKEKIEEVILNLQEKTPHVSDFELHDNETLIENGWFSQLFDKLVNEAYRENHKALENRNCDFSNFICNNIKHSYIAILTQNGFSKEQIDTIGIKIGLFGTVSDDAIVNQVFAEYKDKDYYASGNQFKAQELDRFYHLDTEAIVSKVGPRLACAGKILIHRLGDAAFIDFFVANGFSHITAEYLYVHSSCHYDSLSNSRLLAHKAYFVLYKRLKGQMINYLFKNGYPRDEAEAITILQLCRRHICSRYLDLENHDLAKNVKLLWNGSHEPVPILYSHGRFVHELKGLDFSKSRIIEFAKMCSENEHDITLVKEYLKQY